MYKRQGADFDAELTEQERRHSASGDASDRLSAGRTAAAPVIPAAVFFLECIVRMSRTVGEGDLSVIPGEMVMVAEDVYKRQGRHPEPSDGGMPSHAGRKGGKALR